VRCYKVANPSRRRGNSEEIKSAREVQDRRARDVGVFPKPPQRCRTPPVLDYRRCYLYAAVMFGISSEDGVGRRHCFPWLTLIVLLILFVEMSMSCCSVYAFPFVLS